MKKITALFVFLLLLAGCQESKLNLPVAKFSAEGKQIDTAMGSYTWSENGTGKEADKGPADQLAKNKKALEVHGSEVITLKFSEKAKSIEAGVWDSKSKKPSMEKLTGETFEIPFLSEGDHFIQVSANFENGNADYVFKVHFTKEEKQIISGFKYPQLLPEEAGTYSLLAVGTENEKTPIENNEKIIKSVNEILSLPTVKQANLIYPELQLQTEKAYVLFDQKGVAFETDDFQKLITFIGENPPK